MNDRANIHKGHRQRLMRGLLDGNKLTEIQMLELILFFCIPRVDTNEISHRLLSHFGGIFEVLRADKAELREIEGIGKTSAEKLRTIGSLIDYYASVKTERNDCNDMTIEDTVQFLHENIPELFALPDGVANAMFISIKGNGNIRRSYLKYGTDISFVENSIDPTDRNMLVLKIGTGSIIPDNSIFFTKNGRKKLHELEITSVTYVLPNGKVRICPL